MLKGSYDVLSIITIFKWLLLNILLTWKVRNITNVKEFNWASSFKKMCGKKCYSEKSLIYFPFPFNIFAFYRYEDLSILASTTPQGKESMAILSSVFAYLTQMFWRYVSSYSLILRQRYYMIYLSVQLYFSGCSALFSPDFFPGKLTFLPGSCLNFLKITRLPHQFGFCCFLA